MYAAIRERKKIKKTLSNTRSYTAIPPSCLLSPPRLLVSPFNGCNPWIRAQNDNADGTLAEPVRDRLADVRFGSASGYANRGKRRSQAGLPSVTRLVPFPFPSKSLLTVAFSPLDTLQLHDSKACLSARGSRPTNSAVPDSRRT